MTGPDPNRPQPVMDAAQRIGALFAAAVIAVGLLWFSITEGVTRENISTVATLAGAAVTAVLALVAYLVVLAQGRKVAAEVTPLKDPRDNAGRMLVPDEYGDHSPEAAARRKKHI